MQGPYTLEQVNADLAARNYRDDEFWAWHEGLTNWVPLYSIGGVSGAADTTLFFARQSAENSKAAAKPPEPPGEDTAIFLAKPTWLTTWQQPVESPVQPEQEDTAWRILATVPAESRPLGEPQTAEAAVQAAPLPAGQEPPREPNAPSAETVELSITDEVPTPLDSNSPGRTASNAPKAGPQRQPSAATRRSLTPKAPSLRGRRNSARRIATSKRDSKRMISVSVGPLTTRRFLTTEQLAMATSREPTL